MNTPTPSPQPELSSAGKAIQFTGTLLGLAAGCALVWFGDFGIFPSVFATMGGAALGMAVARPLALAVSRRK